MYRTKRPKAKHPKGIFLPDMEMEVKAIAMQGLSDEDIAKTFSVPLSMFRAWKRRYPSFKKAIEYGRTHADAEVVAALFKKATGKFTIPVTEVVKYGESYDTVEIEKHFPPDTDAIKYWLNNRKKDQWQQRSAVEQSGPGGKPIEVTTNRSDLIDAIVNLVKPKPDGDADKPGEAKRPKRPLAKSGKVKKKG